MTTPPPTPGTDEWFALTVEDVIEPDLPIVDPHHHLWPAGGVPYGINELLADTRSGHRIERTVFIECGAGYRQDGPAELASVGETTFVAEVATTEAGRLIGGIVAHADLRLPNLDHVLDAHVDASAGLLRGIRDALSRADHPEILMIPGHAPEGLAFDPKFQAGVRRLAERGLTYDTWQYHYQADEFLHLARAVPETTMVLDHLSTPLGVGPYAAQREEIYTKWRSDMTALATCENVVVKLGGLAMPDNGFGWNHAAKPPTSDEFLVAQSRYYIHMIETFGPSRCMFESNFPVDRLSLSYVVLWNAFKKLTAGYSASERTAMFSGTATKVYRL
jgi:L-fuconolactonase